MPILQYHALMIQNVFKEKMQFRLFFPTRTANTNNDAFTELKFKSGLIRGIYGRTRAQPRLGNNSSFKHVHIW